MRKYDLHAAMMQLARDTIRLAIFDVEDDGERVFVLHKFLDTLANRLDSFVGSGDHGRGFALNQLETARYLYCCLAMENGDDPAGLEFRGMPVAD